MHIYLAYKALAKISDAHINIYEPVYSHIETLMRIYYCILAVYSFF